MKIDTEKVLKSLHLAPQDELNDLVGSSGEGLSHTQVIERQQQYGRNALRVK